MINRNIVECILINKKNEILLQKKTKDYPTLPGGYWCLFGGEIEPNENPKDTIEREIKEELGVNIAAKLFKKIRYKVSNHHGDDYIFSADFPYPVSKIRLTEGGGFAFFDVSELRHIKMLEFNRNTLREFFYRH